jgi:predicted PurR-regulated permease PerM
VQYASPLGLVVGILDLIPLAGSDDRGGHRQRRRLPSTRRPRESSSSSSSSSTSRLENHVLQPLVYGRTVQLSRLIVLVAVLMAPSSPGVIGALGAIPVAGSIQVVLLDWLQHRRLRASGPSPRWRDAPHIDAPA